MVGMGPYVAPQHARVGPRPSPRSTCPRGTRRTASARCCHLVTCCRCCCLFVSSKVDPRGCHLGDRLGVASDASSVLFRPMLRVLETVSTQGATSCHPTGFDPPEVDQRALDEFCVFGSLRERTGREKKRPASWREAFAKSQNESCAHLCGKRPQKLYTSSAP